MRSSEALAHILSTRIDELSECAGNVTLQEIARHDGLKSHLLDDPLSEIDIWDVDRFSVDVVPASIATAILRDFMYGYERASQQWASTASLCENIEQIAWGVVTSYYCGFFCAIEILRLRGAFLISCTGDEIKAFFGKATGNSKSEFLAKKHTNFVGTISSDFTKVEFKASGAKPHQFAWQQMSHSLFSAFPKRTAEWIELDRLNKMCKGDKNWQIPSDIRNRWNYRDAHFFGAYGQKNAQPFMKLIGRSKSATAWIGERIRVNNESEAIASLATMVMFLWGGMNEAYNASFATRYLQS